MGAGETEESILEIVCGEVWIHKSIIASVNRSPKRKTGEFLFDLHSVDCMCGIKFFKDPIFHIKVLKYFEEWKDCVDKLNRNKSL